MDNGASSYRRFLDGDDEGIVEIIRDYKDGLILYLNAFGFAKTERFFTAKTYRRMSFCALACYSLAKSYSFYTGANHIESIVPLGTPGAILSSGLILLLNICVGVVVAGTMYTFYAMFRKGNY